MLKAVFGHLKTVLIHKYWVFYYCCKLGIPWQGLLHDLSKFSPYEFIESVKFYQGGKRSPIKAAKEIKGYSIAWQHHKGRNKHHYEYWTDNYDKGTTCIKMPYNYALELIADYLGAGKAYNGRGFNFKDELDWWRNHVKTIKMHDETKAFVTSIFSDLANGVGFKIIRQSKKYEIY